MPIFQQSVTTDLYLWLLKEMERRGACMHVVMAIVATVAIFVMLKKET